MIHVMGKLKALLVCCACVSILTVPAHFSQAVVGQWTTHINSSNLFYVFSDGSSVWCASSGGAFRFDPDTQQFTKIVRNTPESLVSNDLSCVAVSDGRLVWFGTRGLGLNLLDGSEWVLFVEGITELPSNSILSFDSVGSLLWAGTTGGLALFDGGSFQEKFDVAGTSGGIPHNTINDILAAEDTVWCATAGGVARGVKSGADWVWEAVNTGLGDLNVFCVGRFRDSVWVGAADGTYQYDGSIWTKRGGSLSWQAVALEEMGDSLYAAAGDSGVVVWQGGTWTTVTPPSLEGTFRGLASDDSDNLWCASSEGLVSYDGANWLQIEPPGPPYNYAEDISISPDGDAWAATHLNVAAMKFDGNQWRLYDNSTTGGGFQDTWLFSVHASSSGPVWFGHCCCPGCRADRLVDPGGTEVWKAFPFDNSKHITEDASGTVWFSSDGNGIFAYDPSDSTYRNVLASLGRLFSNTIETIAPVSSSLRWIGHALAGVDFWDDAGTAQEADDIWRHFSTGDGLVSTSITSSALVGDRVYFGTPSGISVFQDTVWLRDYDAFSLAPASAQVNDLAVDALGNVWVATTGGVAKIGPSGDVTTYVHASSGLVSDHVRCVAVDNTSGRVWCGTPMGISVLHAWIPSAGRSLADAHVYPNPFRPDRGDNVIRLGGVPSAADAWVYDLAGRRLRSLGTIESGQGLWDGTDENGQCVAPGIYLIRLKIENATCIRKVAVIR